jgi:hypothetical protein
MRDGRSRRPAAGSGLPWLGVTLGALGCTEDPCPEVPLRVELRDANNFQHEIQLDTVAAQVEAAHDAHLGWGGLQVDMLGHPIDPLADVDSVNIVLLDGIDRTDVAQALASESLRQTYVKAVFQCEPRDARCQLSAFTFFGTEFDVPSQFTVGSGTWMVALRLSTEPNYRQYKKLLFLEPDSSTSVHEASFENESSMFRVAADLTSGEAVQVRDAAPRIVSWAGLSVDGSGNPIDSDRIDTVWLAQYEDATPGDLEDRLVDLELIGDRYWQMPVDAVSEADLAELRPLEDGGPEFDGFDGGGSFLLGLRCSTCMSPMPLFLAPITSQCL